MSEGDLRQLRRAALREQVNLELRSNTPDIWLMKVEERAERIGAGEPVLKVNTRRLRGIIPYVDFKCHPLSSVARNAAIKRSDVDGALVVLAERASSPEEQFDLEMRFVEDLRAQGFSVSHRSEIEKRTGVPYEEMEIRADDAISFFTEEELEEKIAKDEWTTDVRIYLGGVSVPEINE